MDSVYKYSKEIHSHIISKATHPYLSRFLKQPNIDQKKLHLLILIFHQLKISDEARDQYITATMLVQTALDVHDDVTGTSSSEEETEKLRNRQLTVLAGDYYSGLYYYILAKLENIELIKSLAEGIKYINEQKIILGQNVFKDEKSIIECVRIIESSLLVKVQECFNSTRYTTFVEHSTLLYRLQLEKIAFKANEYSFVYNAFSHQLFKKNYIDLQDKELAHLNTVIDKHIKTAYQCCSKELQTLKITDEGLLSLFKNTLMEDELRSNSFVEEG